MDLEANLTADAFTTLLWRAGSMTVAGGKTVKVAGTFTADSTGTIGNPTMKWTLQIDAGGNLSQGKGKFDKCDVTGKGNMSKAMSSIGGGTDEFEVNGTVTLSDGGTLEVASGTLLVDEDLTQSDSGTSTVVDSGQTLDVAGSIDVAAGSLDNQGGTVEADSGLTVESGATMSGYGSIIGNLTNSGTLNVGETSAIGTLAVTGNFTNSSSGVVNMEASSSSVYDQLHASGDVSLDGTLNFTTLGSYQPGSGDSFALLTYDGSLTDFSMTLNLPTLAFGYYWDWMITTPAGGFAVTVAP